MSSNIKRGLHHDDKRKSLKGFKQTSDYIRVFKNFYLAGLGLSCSMWHLVLQPGIEHGPPASGAQSLITGPPGEPQE